MPRIHIDTDDFDELDDEFAEQERVFRRPKEEKSHKPLFEKRHKHYDPDAARRKEYTEDE